MKQSVIVALLTLLPLNMLAGCAGWRVQEDDLEEALTPEHPSRVRATLLDSNRVVLEQAFVAGDTLIGREESAGRVSGAPLRLPLEMVSLVEIEDISAAKTGRLLFFIGAVALTVYAASKSAEGMFSF